MSVRVQVIARIVGSLDGQSGAVLSETQVPTKDGQTVTPFGAVPVSKATLALILRDTADELDPEGGR